MGSTVYPAAGGGVTQKVQEFTSTGSFVTPSNVTSVEVFLVGGGGGGGYINNSGGTNLYGSGGGGGGGVIKRTITVTAGTTYTVTIGGGGAGATSAVAGGTGSTTSFGALASVLGGGGGGSFLYGSGFPTLAYPTIGATGGGGAGTDSSHNGGCGGGAGGSAFVSQLVAGQTLGLGGGATGFGAGTTGFSTASNTAGIGIGGYGNGGAGGSRIITSTSQRQDYGNAVGTSTSVPGRSSTTGPTLFAGTNATANTGDGGSGTMTYNVDPTPRNGYNGGSGYARVIYWS